MKVKLSGASITNKEKKYVMDVLNSGILSIGKYTEKFENKMKEFTGRKYAVAVSSGTAGLFLLLKYFGIGSNDDVITSPFSFVASSNVIVHAGANPVFCDIDSTTMCISAESIVSKIEEEYYIKEGKLLNRQTGNVLKGILPVDIFGIMPDYTMLNKIAKKYKIFIIEDSCEALGSDFNGKKAGSFGSGSVLAFYPNKQIATGEGGMVLTDDKKIYEYVKAMRNQGRRDMDLWLDHSYIGYNFRIDEMSSALGCAQMERIDGLLKAREKAAAYYTGKFREFDGIMPAFENKYGNTGWFVYVISVDSNLRNRMMNYLIDKGIGVRPYFTPIHLQPCYGEKFGFTKGMFPICEETASRTIALPFYSEIRRKEQDYVIKCIKEFLK